jgi:hypothetical protein
MLLETHARYFVRHELKIRSYRDRGKPMSFRTLGDKIDVENVLTNAVAEGTAVFPLRNNDVISLTKIDVREADKLAILLFRRSDPDAATPVFENTKTKRLRLSDKKDDEAEAVSAHVFINLVERLTPGPTYRAVIEEVPGIGRSFIQGALQHILRPHIYLFRDERGETKDTYSIPWLEGVPSETVGGALSGGALEHVELVRPPKTTGLDLDGLVPHEERMKLTVKATSKKGILTALDRIRDWAYGHNWSKVRVRVSDTENRSRVVDIARNADAADVLFVHSEKVTTEKPLLQCTDKINEELVAEALAIFAKRWK